MSTKMSKKIALNKWVMFALSGTPKFHLAFSARKKLISKFVIYCMVSFGCQYWTIMSNTRDSSTVFHWDIQTPRSCKRVENTICSRLFLTKFEVLG